VPADIGQGDVPWTVLADPEGNEFCVLDPRPTYRDTGPVAAVVADCADPAAVAGFWATGHRLGAGHLDASGLSLRSPDGIGPYLELLPSADPKVGKNRVHLDVAPYQDEDHAAAILALTGAGAVRLDIGQGTVPWTVLADPEGSEFCVLSRGDAGAGRTLAAIRGRTGPAHTPRRRVRRARDLDQAALRPRGRGQLRPGPGRGGADGLA
jgi:hypothetical protein